ncbi:MAG: acyltransferase family protein [Cyclobacteriaceae bacterium]
MEKNTLPESNTSANRLLSLDAFRGFTIAAMIIVNNPGSWSFVYPPLLHAEWHGITPTDLIFPFFLFIVGVSIALAYSRQLAAGREPSSMVAKILKRSLYIFLLGLFLNLFPFFDFGNLRIPGVLQRIAIVFLVCALLFLYTSWKSQAFIGAGLLLLYWLVFVWIPVPGVGVANLEPGTNIAAWLDSLLIPGNLYQGNWDPEGLLSTLPSIVSGISGMLVGILFTKGYHHDRLTIWLFVSGFIAFVSGSVWDWFFPLNKNLWTSSFVLYTSGLAAMTLAFFYFVIDVLGHKRWTKVGLIFGANAITAYVLSGMLARLITIKIGDQSIKSAMLSWLDNSWLAPQFVSLIWALFYCTVCFIPVYILYKKRIFIKV